jgi:hypothetical protein
LASSPSFSTTAERAMRARNRLEARRRAKRPSTAGPRDEVDLVGDDDPGPEGRSLEEGGEALVRGNDDVGVVGADRVAVIAGGDPDPRARRSKLLAQGIEDFLGEGPVGNEVGVDARFGSGEGATERLPADERLPGPGRGRDEGARTVEHPEALCPLHERKAEAWVHVYLPDGPVIEDAYPG